MASTIRWPSTMLCPSGFSTYTSFPARHPRIVGMACQWSGVPTQRTSMLGSSIIGRKSCIAFGFFPCIFSTKPATGRRRRKSTSAMAAISTSGCAAKMRLRRAARPPAPIMPARIRSLGELFLANPFCNAKAGKARAEDLRKLRRGESSIVFCDLVC